MLQINKVQRIYLGVLGENLSRTIQIDMSAWAEGYPNATVEILHRRNGDQAMTLTGASYNSDTMVLTWMPTNYDTFYDGEGQAEIRMVESQVVKKSIIVTTWTAEAVVGGSGEVIESDFQEWLNEVISQKQTAVAAKNAAEDAAETAEAAAERAEEAINIENVAGAQATTLPSGEDATARILTTPQGKVFDFGIPKGIDGAAGIGGVIMDGSELVPDIHNRVNLGNVIHAHQDISGKTDKVSGATNNHFAALDENGNLKDSGHSHEDYLTQHQDISGKADKVSNATNGNFAALDANGNLKDSGHKHSDYLTQHQDISGKADKVSGATNNHFAALDENGNLKDSGYGNSDYAARFQGIDTNIANLQDGLAIIANGNTHAAIASGQFVYIKNHSTLGEGLYKATAAIGANEALTTSNVTADAKGGLNALKADVDSLSSKFTNVTEESLTYTDSNNHTVTFYFRTWENVLTVIMNNDDAIILPTAWTSIGALANIKPRYDRYIPFTCPGGGGGVIRIYPDGGTRIIGNQSTSVYLQTSATVMFK